MEPVIENCHVTEEGSLCDGCMASFIAKTFWMNGAPVFTAKYCQACVEKEEARQNADTSKPRTRAEKWLDVCPLSYSKTDISRLEREAKLKPTHPAMTCQSFISAILARPLNDRGLGLTGDSRLGKTRLVFALLKKYYLAGATVRYTYAPDFSDEYAASMSESADKGNRYLERCIQAPVWFLDDLGKGRLSEAAQRALLRVIEKRTNSELPIFVTTNSDGHTLIKRMVYDDGTQSEYAGPMIARLREFCDFYQF